MSATASSLPSRKSRAGKSTGVRLHRFTLDEYHRMAEFGVFREDDPFEMLGGYLFIKLDQGPPYEVPLGIPPEVIAGPNVEPYPQRKFTVKEYHRLLDSNALPPTLRTELVEGWVVEKMTRNSLHDATLQKLCESLSKRVGKSWKLRIQMAITMDEAESEPDVAIVSGPVDRFEEAHPRPFDVELLVEVSDSTLRYDRGPKQRDYARNGIRCYWVLNPVNRQVEEYTDPTGPTAEPAFGSKRIFRNGDAVPVVLGGRKRAPIPVDELLRPRPT